jgi:hypothetical protein
MVDKKLAGHSLAKCVKNPQRCGGWSKLDSSEQLPTAMFLPRIRAGANRTSAIIMKQEPELPPLTDEQVDVLRRFALLEVSREEMLRSLSGAFDVNFDAKEETGKGVTQRRSANNRFPIPEPGIVITRQHISNALERKRFELISERDLVYWATILLLNDAYVFDPGDEDLIAEWLNDISFNLDAS